MQEAKKSRKKDNADLTRDGPDLTIDESGLNMLNDDDSNDVPEALGDGTTKVRGGRDGEEEAEEEELTVAPPLMGLDEAILYSIEKCCE